MLEMKPIGSLMGYMGYCNSSSEIQSKLMLLGPKGERMKVFVKRYMSQSKKDSCMYCKNNFAILNSSATTKHYTVSAIH